MSDPSWKRSRTVNRTCGECRRRYAELRMAYLDGAFYCFPSCNENEIYALKTMRDPPDSILKGPVQMSDRPDISG